MAFRTLEISHDNEIHVEHGQLVLNKKENIKNKKKDNTISFSLNEICRIPLEDLSVIFTMGNNIRLSTMAMNELTNNNVLLVSLDNKYNPTSMIIPCNSYYSQSLITKSQIELDKTNSLELWKLIIHQKILNQAKALTILGKEGESEIFEFSKQINKLSISKKTLNNVEQEIDNIEAVSANKYFQYFHFALNRRTDDPINSALNYGYAIVRSAIARSLLASGFLLSWGLHHKSQFNDMNLVDDLIEPYRAIVDIVAHRVAGNNVELSRTQRYELSHVLNNACIIDGNKTNIFISINLMVGSIRNYIMSIDKDIKNIKLPTIIPEESMEIINE